LEELDATNVPGVFLRGQRDYSEEQPEINYPIKVKKMSD
jgi:hypothetical protein